MDTVSALAKKITAALCATLFTLFCVPSPAAAESRTEWEEEILLQFSELRKAQGELRQQVAGLQAEVAALKSGGKGSGVQLSLREADYRAQGSADAPVAIVEFSDFECPYCRRHKQGTMPSLLRTYVEPGKARYYFIDFPLDFHKRAEGAAIAAACAHGQGQFWKMHDRLFDNQGKLAPELYPKLAADIGLDPAVFGACLNDSTQSRKIRDAITAGQRAGIQGTPAFLIGRLKDGMLTQTQLVSGARPFADFERVIESYLAQPVAAAGSQ